jgi:hypothetical protein
MIYGINFIILFAAKAKRRINRYEIAVNLPAIFTRETLSSKFSIYSPSVLHRWTPGFCHTVGGGCHWGLLIRYPVVGTPNGTTEPPES